MLMDPTSEVLDAALKYADMGLRVFPVFAPTPSGCCTCRQGSHCSSPGKHPRLRGWMTKASSDEKQIREWFTKYPTDNVGIVTGGPSGLFVIDLDGEDGVKSFEDLVERHGDVPPTLTVRTARGLHLYFYSTVPVRSRTALFPGIDVRGDGGMVVAPPSVHKSGARYTFEAGAQIAEAPTWITEQVAAVEIPDVSPHPTEDHSADDDDSHDSEIIPEGERNTALTCYAGAFRAQGQTFQEIREQLLIINAKNCKPPLPEQEVEGIARSVARYKPNGKRQRIRPDENKLFWVKLEVNKILGDPDIRLMKEEQRGWFMFLLLEAWKAGGTLPADDRSLYVLLGCSSKQRWKRMKDEVLKKFRREIDSEGNPILVLDWMAETYAEQLNALNQRISAGKKSGEARAQKAAASKKGAQAASGAQMEAASLTA